MHMQITNPYLPVVLNRRPAREADETFLFQVYASSRTEEADYTGWTEAQKDAYLRQQFRAQDSFYRDHWPEADYDVLVQGGEQIGRLYVNRRPWEIMIMDISLLPKYRGRGIGTQLLHGILSEAARREVPVHLHVEAHSRARKLYERLGFVFVREEGPYMLLEKLP